VELESQQRQRNCQKLLVCACVRAIMVHEQQHSHVRAHGGYAHPHHHAVRVWPHLQGGAGMIWWSAFLFGLFVGFLTPPSIITLPRKRYRR
jgi:ABC-type nickel/cobalt efflux system permease component RcnA